MDKYYYIAEDVINHMAVAQIGSLGLAVIAVLDKLRVIN